MHILPEAAQRTSVANIDSDQSRVNIRISLTQLSLCNERDTVFLMHESVTCPVALCTTYVYVNKCNRLLPNVCRSVRNRVCECTRMHRRLVRRLSSSTCRSEISIYFNSYRRSIFPRRGYVQWPDLWIRALFKHVHFFHAK